MYIYIGYSSVSDPFDLHVEFVDPAPNPNLFVLLFISLLIYLGALNKSIFFSNNIFL